MSKFHYFSIFCSFFRKSELLKNSKSAGYILTKKTFWKLDHDETKNKFLPATAQRYFHSFAIFLCGFFELQKLLPIFHPFIFTKILKPLNWLIRILSFSLNQLIAEFVIVTWLILRSLIGLNRYLESKSKQRKLLSSRAVERPVRAVRLKWLKSLLHIFH